MFEGETASLAQMTPPRPRKPKEVEGVGEIYALTCVCHPGEGWRYIGRTFRGVEVRLAEHLEASEVNTWQKVYRWIRDHGKQNIRAQTIESDVPESEIERHEEMHIVGSRSAGDWLTNQDDFWTVDEHGRWAQRWPTWPPFREGSTVSFRFICTEVEHRLGPEMWAKVRAAHQPYNMLTSAQLPEYIAALRQDVQDGLYNPPYDWAAIQARAKPWVDAHNARSDERDRARMLESAEQHGAIDTRGDRGRSEPFGGRGADDRAATRSGPGAGSATATSRSYDLIRASTMGPAAPSRTQGASRAVPTAAAHQHPS